MSENLRGIASAALRPATEPCGPEKWGFGERVSGPDAHIAYAVELIGIEPTTSGLQSPRSPS